MDSDNKGRLFVFAAPSGARKTTLVHAVVTKHPELRFSISYTTRKPRRNEANGVDYLFVDEDEFRRLRDEGELLEYAEVFDHFYATSRSQVEKHLADNRNVILEIDWQGARQVRASMPECVSIFILPPSRETLLQRLPQGDLDADRARALLGEAASAAGVKKGLLMKSLRAALLGSLQGPDLVDTWILLHRTGQDRVRLEEALRLPQKQG